MPFTRILLLVSLSFLLSGCSPNTDNRDTKVVEPISVTTELVRSQKIDRIYQVPGTLISDDRVQLSSRISGFIQTVKVREGDKVNSGDLLVEIDPADVEGNISRTQAMLQSANADLLDAEKDVGKFSELTKKGGLPADTLRKAQVRLVVAQSRVAEAKAALATAQAQKRYTRIVSPVAGVVTERNLQPGDLATPGVSILVVESRQSLVFQTFVAEQRVSSLEVGELVEVRLDALPRPIKGSVLRKVPSGDPVTRRYEIKILLPASQDLLPGMFGRASFVIGQEEAIVIPASAMVNNGGLQGVYIMHDASASPGVDANPVARFRWLRTRQESADGIEVTAGLSIGDLLILSPPAQLTDGVPILAEINDKP